MQWYPVGPSFVFGPRVKEFRRLSRRNERGEQAMVLFIAIDPTDPQIIYTIDRPWWGGRSAFRTRDGGNSWESILDALVENDVYVAPTCMAINPAHPETLYIGTGWDEGPPFRSFGIYVSHDRGDNWKKLGFNENVMVNQLLIDPRNAGDLTKSVIVAGTADGVYVSRDGGATWVNCDGTSGFVSSLVADFPPQGNATYYAGIMNQGVFYHADDANLTQSWVNLNEQNVGLPSVTNVPFEKILIDLCRAKPERVYAWHFKSGSSVGLYTTSSAMIAWTQAAPANKLPSNDYESRYAFAFAVAPNSPGDGKNDLLFFTPRRMARSIDSGNTWVPVPDNPDLWFHEDGQYFAFFPLGSQGIPLTYHGCDGGIGVSTRYADPTFDIAKLFDYNEQLAYDPNNGVIQNINHGHQGSACLSFASHPTLVAMNYVGCQDTGTAGGDGQVWRSIQEVDVGQVAAAPGTDGIKVWTGGQLPSFLYLNTDKGELWPAGGLVTLDDGGAPLSNSYQPSTNRGFAVGEDGSLTPQGCDALALTHAALLPSSLCDAVGFSPGDWAISELYTQPTYTSVERFDDDLTIVPA